MIIHWDWVWTITVISVLFQLTTMPWEWMKKERLLAEADAERAKRDRLAIEKTMR